MVLEGGSIDVNGRGLLLTTEACLLHPNRNPNLNRSQIEQALRDMLGVHTILWLGDGIVGDDTDGHIDDLSRFYRDDGIVTVVEPNRRDKNHRILQENLSVCGRCARLKGGKFKLVELPMPKPSFCDGQQLPASYANFLIINGAVLMPAFRQPKKDAEAAEVLGPVFPAVRSFPSIVWNWCGDLGLSIASLNNSPPDLTYA
jgi:agmatine deiminase